MKTLFFVLLLFFSLPLFAQKIDSVQNIIGAFIESTGGIENWKKVKSLSLISTENTIKSTTKYIHTVILNEYERIDKVVGFDTSTYVFAKNDASWAKTNGVVKNIPSFLKSKPLSFYSYSLYFSNLDNLDGINYIGYKEVEGKKYKVLNQKIDDVTNFYFFDEENMLKFVEKLQGTTTIKHYFYNYRNYGLLWFATSVKSTSTNLDTSVFDGLMYMPKSNTLSFSHIKINPPIDKSLFEPPKQK